MHWVFPRETRTTRVSDFNPYLLGIIAYDLPKFFEKVRVVFFEHFDVRGKFLVDTSADTGHGLVLSLFFTGLSRDVSALSVG
jgi:hypothetical protein